MRFDNKRALVTGGGSGIGRAVCLAFAREGAELGVADVSLEGAEATAQEVRENDSKALALQVDVANPAAVKAMVDRAVAVNLASVAGLMAVPNRAAYVSSKSDEASFITGAIFPIDGGFAAGKAF